MTEFDEWLIANKKTLVECKGDSVEIGRLAFEDGYKAGFIASDNGDSDTYYKLTKEN